MCGVYKPETYVYSVDHAFKKRKIISTNYAQLSAFVGRRNRFGFVLISQVELNDSFVWSFLGIMLMLVKRFSFAVVVIFYFIDFTATFTKKTKKKKILILI